MKGISRHLQRIATAAPILIVAAALILFGVMHSIDLARQPVPPGNVGLSLLSMD